MNGCNADIWCLWTQIPVQSKPSIQFFWFISFIPLLPAPPPPPTIPPPPLPRLHGVIFSTIKMQAADECQQYTQGPIPDPSTRAPLLQQITIMCCSTWFHSALTRSTSPGLVLMCECGKGGFIARFCTILFISRMPWYNFNVPCFCFSFCFRGTAGKQDQTCQVYGCARHCVKP